jgi:hypothetical protein
VAIAIETLFLFYHCLLYLCTATPLTITVICAVENESWPFGMQNTDDARLCTQHFFYQLNIDGMMTGFKQQVKHGWFCYPLHQTAQQLLTTCKYRWR